jgi:hypothetical protein
MTNRAIESQPEAIIESIFAEAKRDGRPLGAEELMRAIGLKRTSINSTYAHVNERRKIHNASLFASESTTTASVPDKETAHTDLRRMNAQLRRELQAERERSEQYAKVIRHLALENHQLKYADGSLADARQRFGAVDRSR